MWFLAPPSAWTRLAVGRGPGVDGPGHRGRADEADGGHRRVVDERVHGHPVPLDHGEHPVGQAGLAEQLGQEERGGGVLLAGLEHEGVAAGQGVGQHPQRDHGREVEGRDAGDHAERLAQRVDVDPRRRLVAEPALQEVGDAAGELHVLEPPGDLAGGVGQHLAVLGGDQRRRGRRPAPRAGGGRRTAPRPGARADVAPQAAAAPAASAVARATSWAEASPTSACTRPVDGS